LQNHPNKSQPKPISQTSRYLAVAILEKVEKNQSFSNVLLNETVQGASLTPEDRAFLTELVYGVIQNKRLLDYQLEPFIKKQKKIDNWVKQLLRLSLYQMTLLDKIPMHAVVNEAVRIAKKRGHKGTSGFVNGVLRSIDRDGTRLVSAIENSDERLAIQYSYPDWIVDLLKEEIGIDETEKVLESLSSRAKLSLRVNTTLMKVTEVIKQLQEEGFNVRQSEVAKDGLICENGLPVQSSLFKEGIITIQDESSMLVAEAMQVEEGDRILDACSAPGGKTTHMATFLTKEAGGSVLALDIHANKLKRVLENADRLKVQDRVKVKEMDARESADQLEHEQFDKILVDAPCSGLGLMRRKPDIRYQKSMKDILSLQKVQGDILNSVAPLLKKGGRLIYSTCTITKKENDEVVKQFIKENPTFDLETVYTHHEELAKSKEGFLHLYPHYYGTDGFFIASIRKR